MPHIDLPKEYPGVRSLLIYRPETAAPLNALVQKLLHDPHPTLSQGERELIAAYVSNLNHCKYCASAHGSIAKHHFQNDASVVDSVMRDVETSHVSKKMKALLKIAAKVQLGGKHVTSVEIDAALNEGATDLELHDTVLIAATFCLFNRYVDGLATWTPDDPELYDKVGKQRAKEGYFTAPFKVAGQN